MGGALSKFIRFFEVLGFDFSRKIKAIVQFFSFLFFSFYLQA